MRRCLQRQFWATSIPTCSLRSKPDAQRRPLQLPTSPNATDSMSARVGIVGGGQLGRMLALAGVPLGIACTVIDPSADAGAAIAAEHIVAAFDDLDALARLA